MVGFVLARLPSVSGDLGVKGLESMSGDLGLVGLKLAELAMVSGDLGVVGVRSAGLTVSVGGVLKGKNMSSARPPSTKRSNSSSGESRSGRPETGVGRSLSMPAGKSLGNWYGDSSYTGYSGDQ